MDQGDIVRGYSSVLWIGGMCLSCKWNTSENLNTYGTITCALFFFTLRLTMFSLSSLLHTCKNYLHAGIQKCGMMISPTSVIKHCKIRDYAGPPRVTFQWHIMCVSVGWFLLFWNRQAYYFTVRGDESHDPSSLLTPMEIWSTGYWWTMIVMCWTMMMVRYRTSWWVVISPCSLISLYTAVWKTKSVSLLLFLVLFHTKHSTMMIAWRY